jgi:cyclase
MTIAIVETGLANVASVAAAFQRLGATVVRTVDPDLVATAEHVVLPGVGSFGSGRAALAQTGLDRVLVRRIQEDRPTLGICLGFQLLAEASEESPGVAGLGVLPGTCVRLPATVPVPHLGWNALEVQSPGVLRSDIVCYAHSYALTEAPPQTQAGFSTHGHRFVGAVSRGRLLGCQFHPELSGAAGERLLGRWLSGAATAEVPAAASGLRPRIVPCLDVDAGRVVKGVRFQGLRDAGDPVELARAYARQGADELVLLDVSATPGGRATAAHTVAAVRAALPVPLTVGGGVRSAEDAARLLSAGADKVAVNSAAVARPELLRELSDRFGRQCIVLSIDATALGDGWQVVTRSGTRKEALDVLDWARQGVALGAGEVLLTSFDRDGTRSGYDLRLLRAVSDAVDVPVVASGGANGPEHFADGLNAGADAVLAASIFHDGDWTVGRLKADLQARGVPVRPPISGARSPA